MQQLTPTRRVLALVALALGGFGIGTTEFASMGLLPLIGDELVPGFVQNPERGIQTAGWLISAYALGVVVGAPAIAVLAARMSQTRLVLILAAAFTVANLSSALMPTFELTMLSRFVSGLPHGAYFGVASLLAARIMGPGRQGAGVALALSGLTIANVIGVPLGTYLGQTAGWRWSYVAIAGIFAITLLLAFRTLPQVAGNPERDPLRELSALRSGRLWLMLAVGAVGFGGFFAIYSYIAETVTRVAMLPASTVPWVLATVGIGMTIGNVLGGLLGDKALIPTMLGGFITVIPVMGAYSAFGGHPVALFVLAFLIGLTTSTLVPSIQSRIIQIAGDAQLLGAAMNHAAFNVGNSLGAAVGGAVIGAGLGYLAPGWVGVLLATAGFGLAIVSVSLDRRQASLRRLETHEQRVVEPV
ncbi:MFS transporter [Agrococcus sp. SGAir0287]|uniref:MFS transporter n=1 Tax=Agrococcus sp. SGAir0287 TaxID=2070347 RepID=UPI0010CCECEA|nr:MFS transporter [Agrococcus sp. SGAir0287]QCR19557.1 MFS transporter [Agrococcus sp. SGAir0287]